MKSLSILIYILLICSCSNAKDEETAPARRQEIPDSAFWVEGVDGGNWYLVEYIHSHRNNAVIQIYNDNDGSLIISKKFTLSCPEDSQMEIADLKEQISAFDGERIYLKSANNRKSCYLQWLSCIDAKTTMITLFAFGEPGLAQNTVTCDNRNLLRTLRRHPRRLTPGFVQLGRDVELSATVHIQASYPAEGQAGQ